MHLLALMREKQVPTRKHGGKKRTDSIGNEDKAAIGRKGAADIDVEKREKEIEGPR